MMLATFGDGSFCVMLVTFGDGKFSCHVGNLG